MSRSHVKLTLKIDTAPFVAAMERLRDQLLLVGESIRRTMLGLRLLNQADRAWHITHYGARNVAADGAWLTDLCAGWVHDSCPSQHCSCRCHGETT